MQTLVIILLSVAGAALAVGFLVIFACSGARARDERDMWDEH